MKLNNNNKIETSINWSVSLSAPCLLSCWLWLCRCGSLSFSRFFFCLLPLSSPASLFLSSSSSFFLSELFAFFADHFFFFCCSPSRRASTSAAPCSPLCSFHRTSHCIESNRSAFGFAWLICSQHSTLFYQFGMYIDRFHIFRSKKDPNIR